MKIVAWITSLSAEEMARQEAPLTISLQNNSRIDKRDVDQVVQVLRSGVCLHEEFKYSCRMDELNNDSVVLVYGHSRGPLGRSMIQSAPLFPKIEEASTWQGSSAPSSAAARLLIQINMGVVDVNADTERTPLIHSPRTATADPWASVSAVESQMEELYPPRDKLLRTI